MDENNTKPQDNGLTLNDDNKTTAQSSSVSLQKPEEAPESVSLQKPDTAGSDNNSVSKQDSSFPLKDSDNASSPQPDSVFIMDTNATSQATETATNQNNTTAASYYPNFNNNTTANNYNPNNSYAYNNPTPVSTGLGIASLVLSIISIPTSCCCGLGILFSILSIIFGCIQPKDEYGKKPGIAIAGIIISAITIVLSILCIVFYFVIGSAESFSSYM